MTVVSAVITQHCTAHANDSLLTELKGDGRVRQPLRDFEPRGAPLLAVFERWEALVFPTHVLPQLTGPM